MEGGDSDIQEHHVFPMPRPRFHGRLQQTSPNLWHTALCSARKLNHRIDAETAFNKSCVRYYQRLKKLLAFTTNDQALHACALDSRSASMYDALYGDPETSMHCHNISVRHAQLYQAVLCEVNRWQKWRIPVISQDQLISLK